MTSDRDCPNQARGPGPGRFTGPVAYAESANDPVCGRRTWKHVIQVAQRLVPPQIAMEPVLGYHHISVVSELVMMSKRPDWKPPGRLQQYCIFAVLLPVYIPVLVLLALWNFLSRKSTQTS